MKKYRPAFSVGEVVQFKSGGLEFTLQSVKGKLATVRWTEGQRVRAETFPVAMLQRVTSPKVSDIEVARRIAFVLLKAAREKPGFLEAKHSSLSGMIEHILHDAKKSDD